MNQNWFNVAKNYIEAVNEQKNGQAGNLENLLSELKTSIYNDIVRRTQSRIVSVGYSQIPDTNIYVSVICEIKDGVYNCVVTFAAENNRIIHSVNL